MQLRNIHKNGVSLIEVLVALAIASIFLISALSLQGRLISITSRYSREIAACIALKSLFCEAERDHYVEQKKLEQGKESDVARLSLHYQALRPRDASSLRDIPGLIIERGETRWDENGKSRKLTLMQVRYVPQE